MIPVRRTLPALLLGLFAGTAATAGAAQFSNVVVFGDSLSDSGYYRPLLSSLGLPATSVAALGRFTTNPGPVWAELFAQYYGAAAAPSNAGGWNFAQGGAQVTGNSPDTAPGFAQRPVTAQVTEYLARNGGAADRGALHTMWAGANDFRSAFGAYATGAITQAQLQTNVLAAATAEVQQVGRLVAAGARYVMVFGLPNIGVTPTFSSLGATAAGAATQLSAGYNTTLFTTLAGAGLRVIPVDTFSLLSEIRANPAAYGISNTTGVACGTTLTGNLITCGPSNLVSADASQTYLFADGIHPTTAAHRIVADYAKSLIDGPTAYSLLAEAPLSTRGVHVQTLADGLASGQAAQPGRFAAFAAVAGGKFEGDSSQGSPGMDAVNQAQTVGLTVRASETVTIGAAIGRAKSKATFGGGMGGFRTGESVGSLFAGVKSGGLYANGALSLSNIDFNDNRRSIRLGNAVRVASSSPSGSNASASLNAGYDFTLGRFTVGPTFAWTSQNVEVNAFEEAGAGSANLRMDAQKRRSEVASFGVRASATFGGITPYAKFTADKELKNDERMVAASVLSVVGGPGYDLPAWQPADASYGTLAVGVRGNLSKSVAFGLNYARVTGRGPVKEDGLSGTLSVQF